jgi:hypothetical protein
MPPSETPAPAPQAAPTATAAPDVAQSLQRVSTLMHAVILLLIVFTASVNVFMLRQVILVRQEIQERKRFLADYDRNVAPVMSELVSKLETFASTNPDFKPILAKYWKPTNAPPQPAKPSPSQPPLSRRPHSEQ